MWQTIIMAILHVIKRDIIETALWAECVKAKSTEFQYLSVFERHWSYRGQGDCARGKESFLLALMKEKKHFNSKNNWKVQNKRHVRELFRRSIHLQTCFVQRTQRHWRKKPLCLRSDGGGVVLSVCDCRALADSGSCFALVAVRLGGFIRDCLHLRRGFVYLRLRCFTFVIYNDFTTGGKRKEKFISSVSQASVWLLLLFILFQGSAPKKWLFCYDLFTLMFYQTCVSFFLSLVKHKRWILMKLKNMLGILFNIMKVNEDWCSMLNKWQRNTI